MRAYAGRRLAMTVLMATLMAGGTLKPGDTPSQPPGG
jgi:hypothetical protein